jgi:thioesterase domain-containing protein
VLPLRSGGDGTPLFCLHPAAGIGWVYSGLLRHLDDGRPIYGLQARGFRAAGPPVGSVPELVEDCVRRIRAIQPAGPYHLLGWSFGACVAHAVAAALQAGGDEVGLLALLDGYPTPPDARPPLEPDSPATITTLLATLGYPSPEEDLDPTGFLATVRMTPGPLADLDDTTIRAMVDVFVRNVNMMRRFESPVFAGDVLLFRALRGKDSDAPRAADWYPHVDGRVYVHDVACHHGDMTGTAALAVIGPVVRDRLNRASVNLMERAEFHDQPVR